MAGLEKSIQLMMRSAALGCPPPNRARLVSLVSAWSRSSTGSSWSARLDRHRLLSKRQASRALIHLHSIWAPGDAMFRLASGWICDPVSTLASGPPATHRRKIGHEEEEEEKAEWWTALINTLTNTQHVIALGSTNCPVSALRRWNDRRNGESKLWTNCRFEQSALFLTSCPVWSSWETSRLNRLS